MKNGKEILLIKLIVLLVLSFLIIKGYDILAIIILVIETLFSQGFERIAVQELLIKNKELKENEKKNEELTMRRAKIFADEIEENEEIKYHLEKLSKLRMKRKIIAFFVITLAIRKSQKCETKKELRIFRSMAWNYYEFKEEIKTFKQDIKDGIHAADILDKLLGRKMI